MIVIPAIDIRRGKCVRLLQGDPDKITVFSENPEEVAERWEVEGAERIHLVDLDGSFEGYPKNVDSIKKLLNTAHIPIQLGGGIRDTKTIELYLNLGIDRIILGTVAYENPSFVKQACQRFPDRIAVGLDTIGGKLAIKGWSEITETSPMELGRVFEEMGVCAIIYTDIERDGMQKGVNVTATAELARSLRIPVIASGGVAGIEDIKRLLETKNELSSYDVGGIQGVIVGKALYSGLLDLREAIELTKSL